VRVCLLQPLKSGTLSLYLSVHVPALIPPVVTSRPTTASRPSSPLNPSRFAPQIRLFLTIVRVLLTDLRANNNIFLFTYLGGEETRGGAGDEEQTDGGSQEELGTTSTH